MESPSDLKKQVGCTSVHSQTKDCRIDNMQRHVESTTASLISERTKRAQAMTRNTELERELKERTLQERGLSQELNDQVLQHDQKLKELQIFYEKEVRRLISLVENLESAGQSLLAQLGDVEVEALQQYRFFMTESTSLSQSLTQKERELLAAQAELDSLRKRKVSVKELGTLDTQ